MHYTRTSSRYAGCALIGGMLATSVAVAANTAPVIFGNPSASVVAGNTYSFQPIAFDFNGDALSFSVSNKPAWASFSARTGRLSGTPTQAQAGSYGAIAIAVTDGAATSRLRQFSISVQAATSTPPPTTPTNPPTTPPPPTSGTGQADLGTNASLHGKQVLPPSDPWNQTVVGEPVDPNSSAILQRIGLTKSIHPDFGAQYNGGPFGIPYVIVPDNQARVPVTFYYANESDAGPYPIPANPPIEPSSDRHLIMITRNEFKLFELYDANRNSSGGWSAQSGAIFDLVNGTQRPPGWTSADAAGLPIFPGLVRYDEVYEKGQINHALRFTVSRTRKAYVPPASHFASSNTDPLLPPMGMRVRLKASFDVSKYPAQAQVILRAMQRYGMILADNGGDFYFSGTADSRWNDDVNNTLKKVTVGDFEVVRMQGVVTR